jgi:glutamate-1-semialdehyde aminotransferase
VPKIVEHDQGAEMVRFAKSGSDVNGGATRLSGAYTGNLIAVCGSHPFFPDDYLSLNRCLRNSKINSGPQLSLT